jgi:hypothetical protein
MASAPSPSNPEVGVFDEGAGKGKGHFLTEAYNLNSVWIWIRRQSVCGSEANQNGS